MSSIGIGVTEEVLKATGFTILNGNYEVPILDIPIPSDRAFDMEEWIGKIAMMLF
jgi:hypothetical protein